MRRWVLVLGMVLASAGVVSTGSLAAADAPTRSVSVAGAVAAPATYSVAQLAALPQTTVQISQPSANRSHTEQGVPLESLAQLSEPVLPNAKNASLRVTLSVRGEGPAVTFALGELDPAFGNHAAVLSISQDGIPLESPKLVVPGDSRPARFVDGVRRITVNVQSPTPTTPPAGAVDLLSGRRTVQLSSALLADLPAQTISVSFFAGASAEQHTEQGPSLFEVLAAAHVPVSLDTWVAAVGSDGYVAVVTPAEALVGGKKLLVSTVEDGVALAQPRLVVDGDVRGGRYVSLVVDLAVGEGM